MPELLFQEEKALGLITLTRSEALNALNLSMIKALQSQLEQWQVNPAIHAVVIKAEGKAFCAGGDVRGIYRLKGDPLQLEFFKQEYQLNYLISQFKKPYIALMKGITMGGGVGISLHGTFPLAAEPFSFAMPETGIGLFPDIGASYLLAACPGFLGLFLALTGQRLSAKEAVAAGLIPYHFSEFNFNSLLEQLLNLDLSVAPYQVIDKLLKQQALAKPSLQTIEHLDKINYFFAAPSVAAIMKKLAESKEDWAINTLEILKKKSPLSLEITWAQLHKAPHLSLAECLAMDYVLVQHFMQGHDFYEGINALLIEKHLKPQWKPDSIQAISSQQINDYFKDFSDNLTFP